MSLLCVSGLSLSYDGEHNAIQDVSFSMEEGEILSIVGESGSGKSTLLYAVLGLLPDGAEITAGSVTVRESAKRKWGRDVGMIFQQAAEYMDPIRKIGSQFDEMLSAHGVRSKKERREMECALLKRMRLKDPERVLRSYPFELSGGMMQRTAIAMAVSLSPALLLADEPTSALDVTTQAQVCRQLVDLNRQTGMGILLVTHNMGVADAISNRIGVMRGGKLVEIGARDEIVDHPKHEYTRELLNAVIRWED